jgi:hypothetical protein
VLGEPDKAMYRWGITATIMPTPIIIKKTDRNKPMMALLPFMPMILRETWRRSSKKTDRGLTFKKSGKAPSGGKTLASQGISCPASVQGGRSRGV